MDTKDKKTVDICNPQDEEDRKFRRRNIWHSFTASLYGGVGNAAFNGMLITLVGVIVGAATINPVLGWTVTSLIMAGVALVGVACTYMAQREVTELNCIQGERLARKNAEALQGRAQTPTSVASPEYPQNQRSDGKTWTVACKSCESSAAGQTIQ